jgi:hypothetical protein
VPLGAIYRAGEHWEAGGLAAAGDVLVDFNGVVVSSFESALREGEMEGRGRETNQTRRGSLEGGGTQCGGSNRRWRWWLDVRRRETTGCWAGLGHNVRVGQ